MPLAGSSASPGAEPMVVARHGGSAVVVMAVEEFERLKGGGKCAEELRQNWPERHRPK